MKRPFGLIGLIYLSVLAVVFYLDSPLTTALTVAVSVAAAAACAVLCIVKRDKKFLNGIAAGATALAAVAAIFLFQNYFAAPVNDRYAEQETEVEGYICSELNFKRSFVSFTVQAEKANGEACDFKLTLTTGTGVELHPYDRISFRATPHASDYGYQLSRRIYLYAFSSETDEIKVLGRHENTLDFYALRVRQALRHSLETMLSPDAAAMAKAVLLGDKNALDSDVRNDFAKSGVSYLIVVSGMHLTIVTLFLRWLLRKLTANDYIIFALIAVFVLAFIAITGFAASVTRAGIMMLLFYASALFLRQADSFSSLGIAALFFAVPNPYIVGDVGLLLSFAATFGILLWSDKIRDFALEMLRIDQIKPLHKELLFADRLRNILKRTLRWIIDLLSVSTAASLWVTPLSVMLMGTVTPLTVIISLFAYPLTCVVLALSLPVAIFGMMPYVRVIAVPLAAVENCFAWTLQSVVHLFAALPIATIRANETYWYVWLAVTALLVALGYVIHAKKRYVFTAAALSAATLLTGWLLTCIFSHTETLLRADVTQSGYVLTVRKDGATSLLGAVGTQSDKLKALEAVAENGVLENVLIPSANSRRNYFRILDSFETGGVYEFSNGEKERDYSNEGILQFGNNITFTLRLTDEAEAKVTALNQRVYVLVRTEDFSALVIPDKGDAADLTAEMRQADCLLVEGSVKNSQQLPATPVIAVSEKAAKACPGCRVVEAGHSAEIRMISKELVTE